ncbi:hypothetical protein A3842_02560 [Paenibacillus sp. P3E]|uniref:hypothetical protein n=1 Tax=Paenibacillus sp. P3E TaxID=1349435 RepID=UPI000959D542|nr:hypothetical protein [Paenibacillus sp. P3E]OKP92274.1 hypothetical protein A3842_02560 [Paenibacillus sp. P3E]
MPKKFKLILSSIVMFLLITLVPSYSPAFAYTGGLLSGKTMYITTSNTLTGGTATNLLTDGDLSTYIDISAGTYVYFTFPTDKNITHFQLKTSEGTYLYLNYKKNTSTINGILGSAVGGDMPKTALSLPDARTIYLISNLGTYRIYELEVFTDDPVTPTATPTPTPTATPTPSATPVPTPTPSATTTPSATPTPKPTVTPEQPDGDRAILTITMINGTEKQYDLPIAEVNSFLTWFDARDAGRGPGMYAIDKHTNNKGPFKKRKDYVVFDKILTYEVSEYTATE